MAKDLFKATLITTIIASGMMIGALVGAVTFYFVPTFSQQWFVGILSFFLITEFLLVTMVEAFSRKKEKKQLQQIYMLTKVIKIAVSLIFVGIFVVIEGKEMIKPFVAVFMAFYLLFLLVESILFVKIEKHIKKNKEKNE
ncbi:putative membrane protein YfcA [Dysgonomonas sp. PH5-45]|uniref:hypothetical protein n=1 Tax=unclassified Dysgonomonas TaxID=2630389 RepID=UPI0024737586|nr:MULTISPECIES: hypothetical protein [unclassified Dysgonomonas]MDH6354088.1 putative membrane protein YfcA [Dysgonomonas sp. PH5-45]MDH6387061.1 putative membrane protein YfcA [Dysgonomonas sp. PH5-37]